ncbi:phosphonate ABC transporter ATP-binding protein [Leptospira interrogans]
MAAMPLPAAVVLRDLVVAYVPGKPVLKGVSMEFPDSSVTAIIGPSGTGKSTLIRSINRLVAPTSGDILFDGQNLAKIRGASLRAVRCKIGMVFQEYNLVERLSVMENVLTGQLGHLPVWRVWLRRFPQQDIDRAFDLLAQVGLDGYAGQRADALSGGQRQRVGIARALMQEPRLLLADEPTSSLDPKTSVEIMELMTGLTRARSIPLIVNMHQVDLARRFADRIVGMAGGNVVFDGPPDALTNDHLQQIYGGEGWLM